MKKIHVFQHVDFEGIGCIQDWIDKKGYSLSYTKFYEKHQIPHLNSFDWLIVMGGPMGVYDTQEFPWLIEEKKVILQAINQKKTVLGICLGSQLIAETLGAKVYPNKHKEIGWMPVEKTPSSSESNILKPMGDSITVFHWHGDTFDLPQGAVRLAKSSACSNQAFLYNDKVLGLQFHFEVTEDSLKSMVDNGAHELIKAPYIQTKEQILSGRNYIRKNNEMLWDILEKLDS